jgi:hypothetical protein
LIKFLEESIYMKLDIVWLFKNNISLSFEMEVVHISVSSAFP